MATKISNKFEKKCENCGEMVSVGSGFAINKSSGWITVCGDEVACNGRVEEKKRIRLEKYSDIRNMDFFEKSKTNQSLDAFWYQIDRLKIEISKSEKEYESFIFPIIENKKEKYTDQEGRFFHFNLGKMEELKDKFEEVTLIFKNSFYEVYEVKTKKGNLALFEGKNKNGELAESISFEADKVLRHNYSNCETQREEIDERLNVAFENN